MEKAEALRARTGNFQSFMRTYSPAMMEDVAKDLGRAYNGIAPTLEAVRRAFGENADIGWLCMLLDDFIDFCGKGTLTSRQKEHIAQMMRKNSNLKVTEILLFFWRLCNANYGRVYGSIDPLFIMDGFNKFLKQREKEFGEYVVTTTDDEVVISDWPVIGFEEFKRRFKAGERTRVLSPEDEKFALDNLR